MAARLVIWSLPVLWVTVVVFTNAIQERQCPDLQVVENGILSAMNGTYGDKVTLQCLPGFKMDGVNTITCEDSGNWNTVIGKCISNTSLKLVVSSVIMIVIVISLGMMTICLRKRYLQRPDMLDTDVEMQPFLCKPVRYFTFVLAHDMGDTSYWNNTDCSFSSNLEDAIEKAAGKFKLRICAKCLYICKTSRRVFVSIDFGNYLDDKKLITAMDNMRLVVGKESSSLRVVTASIQQIDQVQCMLAAQILREKHKADGPLDDQIDFNTQYIKLKLQSHISMGAMMMDEIERPDYYQDSLNHEGGNEIQDEDLIKANDFEKYILLRGRAGIGKSTLMQRLLWKWANGDWATQFKAIFLLNLRFLVRVKDEIDFATMISRHSATSKDDFVIDQAWLLKNEMSIIFVLDGLDEVDFKKYWSAIKEHSSELKLPIHWCFNLIRREFLSKSTIIVSSRPFADLSEIGKMLKRSPCKLLQVVELMGLTRERVLEFVQKNAKESSREFVWQTLVKNPILMSISSITFYCAALCKILGEYMEAPCQVTTYTQITAYVMNRLIQRSKEKGSEVRVEKVLRFLSILAFNGFVKRDGKAPLGLVFESKELEEISNEEDVAGISINSGLLMQTKFLDQDVEGGSTNLSQFVHLMIQELLAMVGILSQSPEEFNNLVESLSGTHHFSMAILFLYGLAFNREDDALKELCTATAGEEQLNEKQHILMLVARNMQNQLQAVQVAHESQSSDVAREVGDTSFKDGCHIENTKLTVIDIMALTFVLKHNPSIHSVRLEQTNLDLVSIQEFRKFLGGGFSHIENISLVDDTLNDEGVTELMSVMNISESLRSLELSSTVMSDGGVNSVSSALKSNATLRSLLLSSPTVTDKGLQYIGELLGSNSTLETLRLVFLAMTTDGLQHLLQSMQQNTTLKELWLINPNLTDSGIAALGDFLSTNSTLQNLRVDCNGMTDQGIQHIADSLLTNQSLRTLWLHTRKLSDVGVKYLMKKVAGQQFIRQIRLYGYAMREQGTKALLETSKTNPELKIWIKKPKVSPNLLRCVQDNPNIYI